MALYLQSSFFMHFAYFVSCLSFFMKDIFWLRGISIVSSGILVFVGIYEDLRIQDAQVFWHSFFILINVWRISLIVYQRFILKLSEFEKEIYNLFEKSIPPKDLKKIVSLGHIVESDEKVQVIVKGRPVSEIGLVLKGKVSVLNNDVELAELQVGKFFGEFSFFTGDNASADVYTKPGCKFISWNQEILRKYLMNNEDILRRFHQVMMKKVMQNISDQSSTF